MYSVYYQAQIQREQVWFITAVLRSYEHLAFDRTLDVQNSIFEFFVSPENEQYFIELFNYFKKQGIVTYLEKLPNRLIDQAAVL
jgi:hypothetical protein